jgi:hypothetical protein
MATHRLPGTFPANAKVEFTSTVGKCKRKSGHNGVTMRDLCGKIGSRNTGRNRPVNF